MTRLSAVLGVVLGGVMVWAAVAVFGTGGAGASFFLALGAAALLLVTAATLFRGGRRGLPAVALVGIVVLARFLPDYFREPAWSTLGVVILSTLTFGFAMLATMLERFDPRA